MSTYDDALIEKAAAAVDARFSGPRGQDVVPEVVRTVLDAIADDLRAEAWDRGYDAASTCHCAAYNEDECGCGYYGSEPIYRDENPYRRERA